MIGMEHIHSDPAYRARLKAAGLDQVGRILSCVDARVAAWSRTTDTIYVPSPDGMPGFFVKRHFFPTWSKRLRGTFRGTFFGMHRGHAEYRALNGMRGLGVPAVRAVAYGGKRIAHFLAACFLITEEIPEAINLTSFAQEVQRGARSLSHHERIEIIEALAEHLALMHAAGCSHGNLFWRNILIRYGPTGQPEFFLLDAQPLRPWERLTPGGVWWLRELAQVTVSSQPFTTRAERIRFMRAYLGKRRLPDFRTEMAQIERMAEAWRRHEDRRIHMNALFEEWNRQFTIENSFAAPAATAPNPTP